MTNAALEVAKERAEEEIVTTSTGVRVRYKPVATSLITDVQLKIPYPSIPMVKDESKGKDYEYENPMDPGYLRAREEVDLHRTAAGLDAMILFGVELVDGLPDDDAWLKKVKFMAKRELLDLSGYDLKDPLDKEFLYKKYIIVSSSDIIAIGKRAGIGREEVQAAVSSFPGDEEQLSD